MGEVKFGAGGGLDSVHRVCPGSKGRLIGPCLAVRPAACRPTESLLGMDYIQDVAQGHEAAGAVGGVLGALGGGGLCAAASVRRASSISSFTPFSLSAIWWRQTTTRGRAHTSFTGQASTAAGPRAATTGTDREARLVLGKELLAGRREVALEKLFRVPTVEALLVVLHGATVGRRGAASSGVGRSGGEGAKTGGEGAEKHGEGGEEPGRVSSSTMNDGDQRSTDLLELGARLSQALHPCTPRQTAQAAQAAQDQDGLRWLNRNTEQVHQQPQSERARRSLPTVRVPSPLRCRA